jgi:hypothetical protein
MNTGHQVIILNRRKKAGVSKDQQYYPGKNYIDNQVRFIP